MPEPIDPQTYSIFVGQAAQGRNPVFWCACTALGAIALFAAHRGKARWLPYAAGVLLLVVAGRGGMAMAAVGMTAYGPADHAKSPILQGTVYVCTFGLAALIAAWLVCAACWRWVRATVREWWEA